MRPSRIVALAAFLGLVPGGIAAAYLGYSSGIYPYAAIPFVFGAVFLVATAGLFVVLPVVRERFG